jgi:dephospho-CoA kinase
MMVLGITGGTGCGKTTALDAVTALGGAVLDCDALYHELLETSRPLQEALQNRFPEAWADGTLDRKRLGTIVFSNPAAMTDLNAITSRHIHDAVFQWLEAQKRSGKRLVAIDAIRLLESDLVQLCNRTIAVLAPTEERVRRLIAREGISEEYARLRISAQPTNEEFSARCDAVLMNDCASAAEFAARCREMFETMLKEDSTNGG